MYRVCMVHSAHSVVLGTILIVHALTANAQRLNEVVMLATHNSYHLSAGSGLTLPEWDYSHPSLTDQLEKYNVRSFELDIHAFEAQSDDFPILHVAVYDTRATCASLRECCGELLAWSLESPGHAPLNMYFDVKTEMNATDWDNFDRILESIWGPRLLTPPMLQGNFSSLNEAVIGNNGTGWPEVEDLRDRVFVVVNSGRGYDERNDPLAFMFFSLDTPVDHPQAVMIAVEDVRAAEAALLERIKMGFLVRTRADNPEQFHLPILTSDELLFGYFATIDRDANGQVTSEEVVQFTTAVDFSIGVGTINLLIGLCTIGRSYFTIGDYPCIRDVTRILGGVRFPGRSNDWISIADAEDRRDAALSAGVHIISTDHAVPSDAYSLAFPEELRCNPTTGSCP